MKNKIDTTAFYSINNKKQKASCQPVGCCKQEDCVNPNCCKNNASCKNKNCCCEGCNAKQTCPCKGKCCKKTSSLTYRYKQKIILVYYFPGLYNYEHICVNYTLISKHHKHNYYKRSIYKHRHKKINNNKDAFYGKQKYVITSYCETSIRKNNKKRLKNSHNFKY